MHNHGHRGSGRRLYTPRDLTPDERSAAFERALIWRGEWRVEITGGAGANRSAESEPAERSNEARLKKKTDHDRAKFAAAMARAEFGRFYWNGRHSERPQQKDVKDRIGRPKR